MTIRNGLLTIVSLLAMAACGGGEGHAEHAHLKGPLGDFHAVLAPVWHSDAGATRVAKACEQSKALNTAAEAVDSTPPAPGVDAGAYKSATRALATSAGALQTACGVKDRPEVEAKLTALHDAFHKLADMMGKH